jgi:hypothetical protein
MRTAAWRIGRPWWLRLSGWVRSKRITRQAPDQPAGAGTGVPISVVAWAPMRPPARPQVKPTHVLNAAGVTGRPNVDWCETHRVSSLRVHAAIVGVPASGWLGAAGACPCPPGPCKPSGPPATPGPWGAQWPHCRTAARSPGKLRAFGDPRCSCCRPHSRQQGAGQAAEQLRKGGGLQQGGNHSPTPHPRLPGARHRWRPSAPTSSAASPWRTCAMTRAST